MRNPLNISTIIKIRQNILGDNDLTVAQTLQKLAKSYEFNRSNDKAILCYREAIRIKANVGSSNNDDFLAFIEIVSICKLLKVN